MSIKQNNAQTALPTHAPHSFSHSINSVPSGIDQKIGLSLIQSIAEENCMFKDQQKNVQSQLNKLKQLSQSLLDENVQLRSLYHSRTHDISNLVKTITINTEQKINDFEHQQFLMRELNFGILKKIKQMMKEKEEIEVNLIEKNKQQQDIRTEMIIVEEQIVNRLKIRLRNNLNQKIIDEKEYLLQSEGIKVNKLNEQINELIFDNKQIEIEIQRYIRDNQDTASSIDFQRRQYEKNIAYINEENSRYRQQIQNDQIALQKMKETNSQEKYTSIKTDLIRAIKSYEKLQKYYQDMTAQKDTIREKILKSKRLTEKSGQELEKLREKKEEIVDKIKQAKNRIRQFKEGKMVKIEQLQNTNKQNIHQIQNTIAKNISIAQDELSKLTNEKDKTMKSAEQFQMQFASLQQKVNQYDKTLRQLNNPVNEIQKIELMIRLKKIR